ncbi:uncharacterized protein LOC106152097 isoform X2 [Lingula anatina]|nr:uncharacterized protein LOC106152097 isoform X2 [Lingula anatina]|eukprot:XP_013381044.1 uncharacterized protein LOC106152097 isoform X2 [Lingula anatina]
MPQKRKLSEKPRAPPSSETKAKKQKISDTTSVSKGASRSTGITKNKGPYPKEVDPKTNQETVGEISFTAPLPTRNKKDVLVFEDWPEFQPNMTPKEVLQAGSFGGTYFRPIKSSVTGKSYSGVWKELPSDWLAGLNIGKQVSSPTYSEKVNTYKVKCGGSLEMWESSGWMHKQDPYGWFQWYCRFYQGRRTADDARQIGRWLRCAGQTGRWKGNLISKCVNTGCSYDNFAVSPVVRQTLQHWGYRLTKDDFEAGAKKFRKKKNA